jgi:hypothetical protein
MMRMELHTVENTSVLIEGLEAARVVGEDVTVGVVSEIFRELHKAFRVVEHTARKGEAAGRHRGETEAVIQRVVVAIKEPRLDLRV